MGSMDMEERRRAQELFAKDCRILISTDAGGEGSEPPVLSRSDQL